MSKEVIPAPRARESSILNVGFGVLNPLGDTLSGKNFTPDNVSSLEAVRKATIDHFSENLLQKSGHFIGIVLRVDGSIKEGAIDPSHWSSSTSLLVKKGDQNSLPDLLQIRVRIPEIHAHLPVPDWLPDPDETSKAAKKAHEIINMYPSFVAATELLTSRGAPDRGSLVWVDFQNRANYSGPTYYDKVDDTTKLNSGEDGSSASGADRSLSDRIASGEYVPSYDPTTTTVELNSGYPITKAGWKEGGLNSGRTRENRVQYFAYGDIKNTPGAQSFMATVPNNMSYNNRTVKVHSLLLPRLTGLNSLWKEYYELKGLSSKKIPGYSTPGAGKPYTNNLTISSGYRGPRFSIDRGDCTTNGDKCCPGMKKLCREGREKYGRPCRRHLSYVAMFSPHATGLAIDFRGNGLDTTNKHKSQHYKTETYNFLRKYAWLFGFYPLKTETWHYECLIPRESWFNGTEFANGDDYQVVTVFNSKATEEDIYTSIKNQGLGEVFALQGEDYDWLESRDFPFAVWVEESVDALSTAANKVYTTDRYKFRPRYVVSEPGREYYSLSGMAVNYLNPDSA